MILEMADAAPPDENAENSEPRWRGYFEESRDLLNSVVLILPLFVAYQIGVLSTGGVKNGVDFVTDVLHAITGGDTSIYLAINGAVLLVLFALVFVLRSRGHFRPKTFPWVLVESTVYAVFFGAGVFNLARLFGVSGLLAIGEMSATQKLVLSIGAGLYEELVFRLALMGGLVLLFERAVGLHRFFAGVLAVVISSVLFSAAHHVGSMGEAFTVSAFTYRFFAGVLFAIIFRVRGLAVVVYTHAIYDVIVLVLRGGG